MKQQILNEIKAFDTIIIHRHVRPDPDAYGSQCGLAELLKESFPEKNIYVVGNDEPSLTFLYKMDEIQDDVYQEALVIVCDTANQERICDKRYDKGKKLIKIDHHPNEDPYGDIVWVDTSASSVSEMIYEFYLFGKDQGLTLSKKAASLIYAGIVGDTGRFLFSNTTKKTFQYASEIIDYGFSFTQIYDEMYKTKLNVAKLNGYVLQNFVLTDSGAAYIKLPKELLDEYRVTPSEASQLVGALGNIEGIKAWVLFVEENNEIRVRFRSKGIVINELAKRFKGGGHPLAAGATINSWETADQIIQELVALCKTS
ncbi:bifunctional oligoribonuclease/PAP phosphatase NrnA [Aeribacillus pallidus]|uniref:DHH family phosphoesterase n=1 Tax=Aeribacillus TaxID=1055323 RepID=UPI0007B4A740|nr:MULTISPECIES: bifunctional oligoribonuclease/PAP phosphatase NrnA [Aeribacillus]KZM56530.1 oligoribonuclease [Aeribacillus pallidus]MED0651160.1 bifunctional oligoribonuclease/PAP phosphatase NrnA [Aeribacillus composti]MED4486521.1 bifunctional oligoribonuclease/PAP phosphatase NrnA [Aeribacillus pallidus]